MPTWGVRSAVITSCRGPSSKAIHVAKHWCTAHMIAVPVRQRLASCAGSAPHARALHWRAAGRREGRPLQVAVAGLGAVGMPVAAALAAGALPGLRLAAVSASDPVRAEARMAAAGFSAPLPPVLSLAALAEVADVVVEAAPPSLFLEVAEPALSAGRTLVALTATQLLVHHEQVLAAAERGGGRVIIPTGALVGLDAVRSASRAPHRPDRSLAHNPAGQSSRRRRGALGGDADPQAASRIGHGAVRGGAGS